MSAAPSIPSFPPEIEKFFPAVGKIGASAEICCQQKELNRWLEFLQLDE